MKMRMLSVTLMAAVVTVSGCGSSSPSPFSVNPTTIAPAGTETAAGSDCADVIGAVKAKATGPSVQSIDATGACTIVTIHTNLSDTDLTTATQLCDAGAAVAYTGDTSSVAVDGRSGKELAAGVKGNPCIGEP